MRDFSVLFVCLGNICRSPTAEGIFRGVVERSNTHGINISIDSAGTSGYHAGECADSRAISFARKRGYDLTKIRSRQVKQSDFEEFDLIVAMDNENLMNLKRISSPDQREKIKLFLDYSKQTEYEEVPDPYYGGDRGFELVIDLIEDASEGLISAILAKN